MVDKIQTRIKPISWSDMREIIEGTFQRIYTKIGENGHIKEAMDENPQVLGS